MTDISSILEENESLRQENKLLLEENFRLKSLITHKPLDITLEGSVPQPEPLIETDKTLFNKYSSSEDKINLFMSLFQGRQDVYARRWENKAKETAGYSPTCANEWKRGVCQKPKIKCNACKAREYLPVTASVVSAHLSGNIVMGVYPLLEDEACYFLVIDFDKSKWQDDISAFRESCAQLNVNFAVERSRSGNGAHVWFFFDEAVTAFIARKFASILLTAAIEKLVKIGFDSYDRLLPNQDTMPQGGLGNLIALPLQKEARKNDNSVFIDEKFEPFPDQWAFLSSIKKTSLEQIETITNE